MSPNVDMNFSGIPLNCSAKNVSKKGESPPSIRADSSLCSHYNFFAAHSPGEAPKREGAHFRFIKSKQYCIFSLPGDSFEYFAIRRAWKNPHAMHSHPLTARNRAPGPCYTFSSVLGELLVERSGTDHSRGHISGTCYSLRSGQGAWNVRGYSALQVHRRRL